MVYGVCVLFFNLGTIFMVFYFSTFTNYRVFSPVNCSKVFFFWSSSLCVLLLSEGVALDGEGGTNTFSAFRLQIACKIII